MAGARSMTGFGRAALTVAGTHLVAEVTSVNQRGLALSVHLPADWSELEPRLVALPREIFQRGKVTVRLSAVRADSTPDLGEPLRQLRELAARHGVVGQPDWHVLLRLTEQQRGAGQAPGLDPALSEAAERVVREALVACDRMRETEGASLVADLAARLRNLARLVEAMVEQERGAPARQRERLLRRLGELGVGVDPGDERVLRELALHADRCDISEEIARLRSHLAQATEALRQPASGRGLDFLTQELLREVNTVGSKAAEVGTIQSVLEAKVEIERFREQVQNVE